jgi:RNA polymerase sigma factor (TIGR02999 family)
LAAVALQCGREALVDGEEESERSADLPALLRQAQGDPGAAERLFVLLYGELRRLAQSQLRGRGAVLTLGATTLVHEAFLRMVGKDQLQFPEKSRFFAYASRAMRGLAIDYSRRRHALKRGRQFEITFEENDAGTPAALAAASDLSSLGDALDELGSVDDRLAELVDLHFFGGLSFGEIAELREVSERTVQRDWQKARMLLHRSMRDDPAFLDRD